MNRVVKTAVGFVGWIGLGAVLWMWTVPTEEQNKNKIMEELKSMPPDQQRNMQDKKAMIVAILKEAAETNENVAAKPWPWKK